MAKGVLGNDPFQKGAASRDLPAPPAPPAAAARPAEPEPGPTAPDRGKPTDRKPRPPPPPPAARAAKAPAGEQKAAPPRPPPPPPVRAKAPARARPVDRPAPPADRPPPPAPPPAIPGEKMISQAIGKVLAEPLDLDPSPPVVPPAKASGPTLMGREPVQHPASPEAQLIGAGPTAHPGSPVLTDVLGGATVAHAGSPELVADLKEKGVPHPASPDVVAVLDEPAVPHAASPEVVAELKGEAIPHSASPEVVEDRVREPEEPPHVPLAWGVLRQVVETGLRPVFETARGFAGAARDAIGLHSGGELDHWGKDPKFSQRLSPVSDFLYRHYWRVHVEGAEHLPNGPCLVVANHSGALPFDGPVLHAAIERERPDLKEPRWLVEDQVFFAPVVGKLINRLGGVRASPENATRLLEDGHPVIVFPEGILGLSKPYAERYQLKRFGRGGYVKLATRLKVPIVPAALVGAAETMPVLAKLPGSIFGVPYIPLATPPLPVPWKIRFAPPVDLSDAPADAEHDLEWVQQANDRTREVITGLLASLLGRNPNPAVLFALTSRCGCARFPSPRRASRRPPAPGRGASSCCSPSAATPAETRDRDLLRRRTRTWCFSISLRTFSARATAPFRSTSGSRSANSSPP